MIDQIIIKIKKILQDANIDIQLIEDKSVDLINVDDENKEQVKLFDGEA